MGKHLVALLFLALLVGFVVTTALPVFKKKSLAMSLQPVPVALAEASLAEVGSR